MKGFKIPAINSLIKEIKESEGNYWMRRSIEDVIYMIKEGDEVMEWLSPWKPGYRFIFSRHENSFTEARVGNQFIIEIKVLDTFYNFITVIKMNEMDAIRTIDCIEAFLYEFGHEDYSSYYIGFPNYNMNECLSIKLERGLHNMDLDNLPPAYIDNANDDIRDINFILGKYSNISETLTPILSFYLSDSELADFAYDLFFVGLIDLEIAEEESLNRSIKKLFLDIDPDLD